MMLTGFLFLLLLSGGLTATSSDLLDDQLESNESFEDRGSTSDYSNYQYYSGSNDNTGGNTSDYSNYQDYFGLNDGTGGSTHLNVEPTTPARVEGLVIGDTDGRQRPIYIFKTACSHRDVLKYVKHQLQDYEMTLPGGDESPIEVKLDVLLYAILDVNEKDQKFVSYIWVDIVWHEYDIYWEPYDFCGVSKIYLPTADLWKPDLTIEEMTEKDKALQSPYLTLINNGVVIQRNDMMVISTCKMEVYKFPFDVQTCTLSFKSAVHSDEHLILVQAANSSWNIDWSHKMMTQSEWLFINMTIKSKTVDNFGFNQSMLVYTISMRRRSALYVANFILPIIFFLCLDLASFLISDSGGEKLSFKVTVLLAVTVMQLILNEILPSSSDRIPLIAVYCIGIFGLMMISLLETILMMYLIEKDSQDNQVDEDQSVVHNCNRGVKKWTPCGAFVCDVSVDETPPVKEVNSSQPTQESSGLEKVSDELKEVEKTLTELNNNRNEERKPGYWTRVTKTINRVFFVCYVAATALFLVVIFSIWNDAEGE